VYKVLPHKRTVKYYESLDDKTAARINKAIDRISETLTKGRTLKNSRAGLKGNIGAKSGI
jgi:mRNA-degrading endonuclease RelE of RelBE toxin-antitoxin system